MTRMRSNNFSLFLINGTAEKPSTQKDSLPFDIRWATSVRVSASFDYWVIRRQSIWLIIEHKRLMILKKKADMLVVEGQNLRNLVRRLSPDKISSVVRLLTAHFAVGRDFGLQFVNSNAFTPAQLAIRQINALIKNIDHSDGTAVANAGNYFHELVNAFE
ncbi:hypothetical protein niasHT_035082 [Heterodera trifolii]|uniref:Uncharacterized protein n=1 Tax=Heterodera trifolii TaxID=157864 RepID=A0ABD2IEF2_9BILA